MPFHRLVTQTRNDLESLAKSNFQILTPPRFSPTTDLITNATKDSQFYQLKNIELIHFPWMSFDQQFNELPQDRKQTIFEEKQEMWKNHKSPNICKVSIAWESQSPTVLLSMVVSKDFPYLEYFNHAILKMKESGKISHLAEITSMHCDKASNEPSPASFRKTVSLFVILLIGVVLSIFCFMVEVLQWKCFIPKLEGHHLASAEIKKIKHGLQIQQNRVEISARNKASLQKCLILLEEVEQNT